MAQHGMLADNKDTRLDGGQPYLQTKFIIKR